MCSILKTVFWFVTASFTESASSATESPTVLGKIQLGSDCSARVHLVDSGCFRMDATVFKFHWLLWVACPKMKRYFCRCCDYPGCERWRSSSCCWDLLLLPGPTFVFKKISESSTNLSAGLDSSSSATASVPALTYSDKWIAEGHFGFEISELHWCSVSEEQAACCSFLGY